jgi:hypothetical protein
MFDNVHWNERGCNKNAHLWIIVEVSFLPTPLNLVKAKRNHVNQTAINKTLDLVANGSKRNKNIKCSAFASAACFALKSLKSIFLLLCYFL